MLPFTTLLTGLLALTTTSVLAHGGVGVTNDIPTYVMRKIAYHQLLNSCWGKQNNLDFFLEMKEAQEVCLEYRPMFDINVFEEEEEKNEVPTFDFGSQSKVINNNFGIRANYRNPN